MVHITIGRAGTGKTYSLFGKIRDMINEGGENLNLLVPDQFSFEAERIIVSLCGAASSGKISVFGFNRLCEQILGEYGGEAGANIDDASRNVLMKKAVESVKDELTVFGRVWQRPEFISELAATVGELKQADAFSEELSIFDGDAGNALSDKLRDIKLITDAYNLCIADSFVDDRDLINIAYQKIVDKKRFENSVFFIDSFTGFTGQQLKLTELIIREARDVYFTFTCDSDNYYDDEISVFADIKSEIRRILELCRKNGAAVDKTVVMSGFKNKRRDLCLLESVVSGFETESADEPCPDITVCAADTVFDEAEYTAREIRRLVREEGYRYKDIAVITAAAEKYQKPLADAARMYGVPMHIDARRPASELLIFNYLFSLLECSLSLSSEKIFAMLKTGLSPLSDDEIFELENYVYIWGIDGARWLDEWDMNPSGLDDRAAKSDFGKELSEINRLRETAVQPILKLKEKSKKTAAEFTKILFGIMDSIVKPKLTQLTESFFKSDDIGTVRSQTEGWNIAVHAFDCLQTCFGEELLTNERFLDSFKMYINGSSVGEIPQTLDEVLFGSADRVRPLYPKIVFLIGVNKGVFPDYSGKSGLLNRFERLKLQEMGLKLDGGVINSAVRENYRFYSMCCAASDKVYFSYLKYLRNGDEAFPSRVLGDVCSKLKNVQKRDASYLNEYSVSDIETPLPAFRRMSYDNLKGGTLTENLKSIFEKDKTYSEKIGLFDSLKDRKNLTVTPETASKIFSGDFSISASKIDDFYHCPFKFFCKFGLSADKLKKVELSSIIRGNIVHRVLEKVIDTHKNDLGKLEEDGVRKEIDDAVCDYLSSLGVSEEQLGAAFSYSLIDTKAMLLKLIMRINAEFLNSDFKVDSCELKIKGGAAVKPLKYTASNGTVFSLIGSVDRVDRYDGPEGSYIKIVDYKTGSKKFDLSDALEGLNLQMLIYLHAIIENGGDLSPAGIIYLYSKGGIPNAEDKENSKFSVSGLVTDEPNILEKMEHGVRGEFIPASFTKTGLSARSSVLSPAYFKAVFKKTDSLIGNMCENIISGKIGVDSLDGSDTEACKYCDYAPICLTARNDTPRQVKKLTRETVAEILSDELGEEKE